jgi:diaminopimelate decarboxylase
MKKSFIDLATAEALAAKYPTPFYVYDERGIREGIRALDRAFAWNDGFKEYFAVKACPNPFLMQIIHEEGCGMDCSSYCELILSDSIGLRGDDIMFSSNVTPAEDFEYARRLGAVINLDDATHVDFLKAHGGIPEEICLRYNPGGEFSISGAIMGSPGEAKYGMTEAQLIDSVKRLMELGAKRFGIHAFLASNMIDPDYYPRLAEILFKLAVKVNAETGANVTFVNLSGGIGIPYRPEDKAPDLDYIGRKVQEAHERIVAPSPLKKLAIKAELGRYITGAHGMLITRAIHVKHIYKEYIGVDACAANLMRPAMYGAYHHITVLGKENAPCDHVYDVTGGLCENNDKFAVDRALPEIRIGDLLAIHDAGAHGYSMGYNYNGKLRCAELLLKADGGAELIRRAETPADYLATFDFCDIIKKER